MNRAAVNINTRAFKFEIIIRKFIISTFLKRDQNLNVFDIHRIPDDMFDLPQTVFHDGEIFKSELWKSGKGYPEAVKKREMES